MSQIIQTTFILFGPLANQTIVLGDPTMPFPFVDGKFDLVATEDDTQKIAHYLQNGWQAYPEGHPALEVEYVGSNIQEGEEPEQQPDEIISGSVDDSSSNPQETTNGPESTGAGNGSEGGISNGNGQTEKLIAVLNSLDKSDDAFWTADGKPTVSAVSNAFGTNVTRADIEAALPGFTR